MDDFDSTSGGLSENLDLRSLGATFFSGTASSQVASSRALFSPLPSASGSAVTGISGADFPNEMQSEGCSD